MSDDATRRTLLRGLAQTFEGLQRAGLTHLSRPAFAETGLGDFTAAPESLADPTAHAASLSASPESTQAAPLSAPDHAASAERADDAPRAAESIAHEETPSRRTAEPAPRATPNPSAARPAASTRLFDDEDEPAPAPARTAPAARGRALEPPFREVSRSDRETGLPILREEVRGCTKCELLARLRKQTVFAAGNPHGKLVVIGEAPGADEDRLGEPFVGKAGKKLDEMLAAFGLDRTQVYIMNAIKCRPPENRVPEPDELANCRPYFLKQLDLLAPKFILCVGVTAAQALLQRPETIGRLRNKVYDYRGAKVVCTYHPSYILRSPEKARRPVWEDLLLLMGEMGIKPKNKQT